MKKTKLNKKVLSSKQIEEELKRENHKVKFIRVFKSTIYSLIIIASVAALIATLVMPVLEINGSSMTPTFNEGDIVLSIKTKNFKTGDVIAFYHGNKILVKRVIAGAGNWINIDVEGNVYVNGKLLEEDYISEKALGEVNIEFPYQVPDGKYFVLGDHRLTSNDSRNSEIGCVSKENIVGKIVFRVWPLGELGRIR